MTLLARLKSFLSALLLRRRIDGDLEDELSFHLDVRTRELVRKGLSQRDAAERAERELGDVTRWRLEAREARGLRLVDELAMDLRICRRVQQVDWGGLGAAGAGAASAGFCRCGVRVHHTSCNWHRRQLLHLLAPAAC